MPPKPRLNRVWASAGVTSSRKDGSRLATLNEEPGITLLDSMQESNVTERSTGSVTIVSHSRICNVDGRWLTKNRTGELIDGLAAAGWNVTYAATTSVPVSFLTYPVGQAVRVLPLASSVRGLPRALVSSLRSDTTIVFMPTVRAALVALVCGRRVVLYAGHAWALIEGSPRWRLVLERLAARRAGRVVAAGDAVFRALAPSSREAHLCVPLVPTEVSENLRSSDTPNKDYSSLRLVFVGSIGSRKGVPELLDALESLPHIRCQLIGPAADPDTAAWLHRRLEQLANVEHLGYLDWGDLREVYRAATALVLPAHNEGFPRVVYEATAFGLAVVVTPVGGIPDRLTNGLDAMFVDPGDSVGLAVVLRELAESPERLAELATNARLTLAPVFVDSDPVAQFNRYLRSSLQ